MKRMGVQIVGIRQFDDTPEIHDRDAVADVLDDGQIVCDEDVG